MKGFFQQVVVNEVEAANWLVVFVSLVGTLFGGWDHATTFLIMLMVADFVLGVIGALKMKRLDSTVMYWGVIRKVVMFVVVAIAFQAQRLLPDSLPLRELTVWFYIGKEGLSFIENTGKLIELPQVLTQFFQQLKKPGVRDLSQSDEGTEDE